MTMRIVVKCVLTIFFQDSDPVHRPLLEFLFVQSCEPYCGFIKSWIYRANVNDPYQEFVTKYLEDSIPWMHLKNKKNFNPQFEILKVIEMLKLDTWMEV